MDKRGREVPLGTLFERNLEQLPNRALVRDDEAVDGENGPGGGATNFQGLLVVLNGKPSNRFGWRYLAIWPEALFVPEFMAPRKMVQGSLTVALELHFAPHLGWAPLKTSFKQDAYPAAPVKWVLDFVGADEVPAIPPLS